MRNLKKNSGTSRSSTLPASAQSHTVSLIPETPRTLPGMDFRGLIPDIRVDNDIPYTFNLGGRRFEVHATPGAEGADNVVLWLPDDKVLLTGDFFGPQFPQFPNLFTMRGEKMRNLLST